MKFKKLGRTGIDVSLICLGTMTWGRQNTEQEGHEQMDYAVTRGINFFDTAELYAVPPNPETQGRTEEIIGTWFAARKNRDKIILASKVTGIGIPWIRGGKAPIDRTSIMQAIEASLKRMQTEYIDLYQLHWPNRGSYAFGNVFGYSPEFDANAVRDNMLEVLQTLNDLVKAGKIRYAGLSNETAWGTMEWLRIAQENNLPRMVSIQNEYSLLCRHFELDLNEVAIAEDVGLLAYSPLGGGMISGKYLDGARPAGTRWSFDNRKIHRDTPQSQVAVRAYIAVAEKHGLDVCMMANAFVNMQKFVTSNIIGATSMQQLKINIDSIDLNLSPEVLADIESVRRNTPVLF